MKKTEVRAKKIKSTELETIPKAPVSEFKYTDHLVIDPLVIGDFKAGKSQINSSGIKKIDTIVYSPWEVYKKQKKTKGWNPSKLTKLKAKINPSFIPQVEEVPSLQFDVEGLDSMTYKSLTELHHDLTVANIGKSACMSRINTYKHLVNTENVSSLVHGEEVKLSRHQAEIDAINFEITKRSLEGSEEEGDDSLVLDQINNPFSLKKVQTVAVPEEKKPSYIDKLKQDLNRFKSMYGVNPAVIKGYIINNVVITDNDKLLEILTNSLYIHWEGIKTIVRVSNIIDDKIVTKINLLSTFRFSDVTKMDVIISILPLLVKFKITDCKNSNDFFGTSKLRTTLKTLDSSEVNWKLELINISRNKNKHSTYVVVVEYPNTEENIKFTLSDCRFTNQSISGYNPPMDKTIHIGSIVRIKDNKLCKYGIRVTDNAEVVEIRTNPSSKKISKDSNNRRMDIVLIKLNTGKKINVYAQDLKFIENKKQDDVNANIKKESTNPKSFKEAFFQQAYQGLTYNNTITYILD